MELNQIAKVCHETNRAFCQTIGDNTQIPWASAPESIRESAISGVRFRINNPDAAPSHRHESWMEDKEAAGWKYGPVKDGDKKEHPCMVPYDQLPAEQKAKDALFIGVVEALRPLLK